MATLLIAVVTSVTALAVNVPTNTPYSPFNTGLKGTSGLIELLHMATVYGINELPKGFKGTLLIPLTTELLENDYVVIKELINGGGHVIVLDERGYSNNLIKYLGIKASTTNYTVLDEVFKYLSRDYPVITLWVGGEVLNLTTYRPTYIQVSQPSVIGATSNYSYADLDSDGYYSLGDSMGSHAVIAYFPLGNGSLTIISDLDVISNELIDRNSLVLSKLFKGATYLALNYLGLGNVDFFKYLLTKSFLSKRDGFESFITPYALISAISVIAYYLTIGMHYTPSGRLHTYSLVGSAYMALIALYHALVSGSYYLLIPAVFSLTLCGLRTSLYRPLFLAALMHYSLSTELLAYLIPLYVLTPYLMVSELEFKLIDFLGPTTYNVIKYSAVMLITSLINVNVLTSLSLMITTSLINCLVHYVRLSSARVELIEAPREVLLRSNSSVLLSAYSKPTTYLALVGSDGGREVFKLSGYSVLKYSVPTAHVGKYSLVINPVITDDLGISRKLLSPIDVEYLVIPSTLRFLKSLKEGLFARSDIKELLGSIELSIVEFRGLVGVGYEGVSKVVRDLISRGAITGFFAEFIKSLITSAYDVVGDVLGRRSRVGEYIGVRPYVPGDELRSIHWSKSLSTSSLVIKEFTSPGITELASGGGGLEPLIIVDLAVGDATSLDRLMLTLLSIYFDLVRVGLEVKSSLAIVGGEFILVLRGRALDVLYRLYRALNDLMPKLIYEYESIRTEVSMDFLKSIITYSDRVKYFSKLVNANKYFTEDLVRALAMDGILPPKPFTVIHSDVLNVRYSLVRYELSRYGYIDVEPGKLASYVVGGSH